MKCISLNDKIKLNNTIVTIGKFDGIHKGHEKLLRVMKEKANGRKTVVLTFEKEPKEFLNNHINKTIVTEQEKQLLLEQQGVDAYFRMPLSKEFLSLSPERFVQEILIDKIGARVIVCGSDFRFGNKASGDVDFLRKHQEKYDYQLIVVEKEKYHKKDISSTGIREKIVKGEMLEACEMLNRPYFIIGKIEQGKKLGRTLGLPTANIIPEQTKLLPPNGVYRTIVKIDNRKHHAITNIGVNPTVETGMQIKVESHLIDYKGDIYGEVAEVLFYEFIRPEMRFGSVDELREQIEKDIEICRKNVKEDKI